MLRGKRGPVIVIDDAPESLRRLQSLVQETPGLELYGSGSTPSEAIELARARQPAIMILDLFLLGGSGVEVLRAIRRLDLDIRVVAVTGEPSEALRKACLDLGARYFFDKVAEFDQIQPALRTLEGERSPDQRLSAL